MREEFWISFGKSYPRKWILYNTKVKGLIFRFHFDTKKAMVTLDVEHCDLAVRIDLWEKVVSLKSIVREDYLPDAIFEDSFVLPNGKEISRVYVEIDKVSIHNRNTWQETMVFLDRNMNAFEEFFDTYKVVIDN